MVDVCETTVPGQVHAGHLVLGGDPEELQLVENEEQWAHGGADPASYRQYLDQMRRQQLAPAAHEQPVMDARPVYLDHVLFLREQRREDHPPCSAPAVQLSRLERVVELEHLGQLVAADEHEGGHKTAHNRRPWLHHGASGGDGGEPTEEAVADVSHVPVPRKDPLAEQGSECCHTAGEGGSDGRPTNSAPLAIKLSRCIGDEDLVEGARVEAVPPEPEKKSAEHHEGGGVAAEGNSAAGVVEPSDARPLNECPPKAGNAANHVDDARARKINDSSTKKPVTALEGAGPAIRGPEPVRDHRVDEPGQERRVDQVSNKLGPLRDRPARDSC